MIKKNSHIGALFVVIFCEGFLYAWYQSEEKSCFLYLFLCFADTPLSHVKEELSDHNIKKNLDVVWLQTCERLNIPRPGIVV